MGRTGEQRDLMFAVIQSDLESAMPLSDWPRWAPSGPEGALHP